MGLRTTGACTHSLYDQDPELVIEPGCSRLGKLICPLKSLSHTIPYLLWAHALPLIGNSLVPRKSKEREGRMKGRRVFFDHQWTVYVKETQPLGWEHPTKKDETGKFVRKSELMWTREEDDAVVGNSGALNALFNVVDQNIFKFYNTCKSAKAAWDILEVAFEGTSKVKISRL
ncbi:gag-pol polyprotein [Cucumis melo var. makuwa]|uniref:Gag-pol polyprotein n=1 Tax=Cucumis melo var. makuwa TaxID=1194695 RepID=A0A5A7VPD1_CUCMM|nr:gag-pol polyprotein [Cucumis melo var. makuwa]